MTPRTIRIWHAKGWLPDPPWTIQDVDQASALSRQVLGRGSTAPHGTLSRWRAGCLCEACRATHNTEGVERRTAQAQQRWGAGLADELLALLTSGETYRDAIATLGITSQAVTAQRHRDATFAAAIDEALTLGRDPHLAHGTATTWRKGCRCPDCRHQHELSR